MQNPIISNVKNGCSISPNGTKIWYWEGNRHRTDGPAVIGANGDKFWRIHGQQHRTDGPAIEHADGDVYWYINGKLHREDGPAIIRYDGYKEWCINGLSYSFNNWARELGLSDEQIVMYKLRYF